jgi:hypothetical protein
MDTDEHNSFKIYTPEGGSKITKESYLAKQEELRQKITLKTLEKWLGLTVKHDNQNKIICFLTMLLTYTGQDQLNIAFNAESSSGKSYIPLQLAALFPEDDVQIQAYTSPTAFFHEQGEWDEIAKVKKIDLRRRIIIFLDMPHDQLLQRLRPLLSHDRREILVKITDKSKARGLSTKSVIIIGFPTVIFCSTSFSMDQQERTRVLLLSPEVTPEKIDASIDLIALKLANRKLFNQEIESDLDRLFLQNRVLDIKKAGISDVIIPEDLRMILVKRFKDDHRHLIPRHQRDFPRLISLVKAMALLNLHQHERIGHNLVALEEDVEAAYGTYKGISMSNELGIPPEVYDFYEKVFCVEVGTLVEVEVDSWCEEENSLGLVTRRKEICVEEQVRGFASKKDLAKRYYLVFHSAIGQKRLVRTVKLLVECGLVLESRDPDDGRVLVYSHPAGYISQENPEENYTKGALGFA